MSRVEWKQNIGRVAKYFYNFFSFHHLRHQIEERCGISFSQVSKKDMLLSSIQLCALLENFITFSLFSELISYI